MSTVSVEKQYEAQETEADGDDEQQLDAAPQDSLLTIDRPLLNELMRLALNDDRNIEPLRPAIRSIVLSRVDVRCVAYSYQPPLFRSGVLRA